MKKVKIGSRGSVLALWQAEYIQARLQKECNLESEIQIVKTKGDKILDTPLAKIGGKGLFTKELEELLLRGEIDLAVHSLKDVPVEFPQGLCLSAITQREDVRDCYISERYSFLQDLPLGAKVGTTSLRRTMQLKAMRPDLDTQSLRGNVQTRLERLKNQEFDAIVLAMAGVNRLGLHHQLKYVIPLETTTMLPAMGQGALGLECREDSVFLEAFASLNDEKTQVCCECEREFVRCLEGGCQVPIGAYASVENQNITLQVKIGLPNGEKILYSSKSAEVKEHLALAHNLAEELISKGAKEILKEAEMLAFA